VSNYLSRSQPAAAGNTATVEKPLPGNILDTKRKKWSVCLISDHELMPSDNWLPAGFWDSEVILVNSEMEKDLSF